MLAAALLFLTGALSGAQPAQAQNTPGVALDATEVSTDTQLLFTLAEWFNPAVFGGNTTGWRLHDGYTYQYFINSRTYAGVKNGDVFLLGGADGNAIVRAGSLADILALLKDRTGANVIQPSRDALEFEYSPHATTTPTQTLTFSSKLPTGWTLLPGANWMRLSRNTGNTTDGGSITVTIDGSAAALAPGLHAATILVRNEDDPTLSTHLRVTLYVTDPGVAVTNSTANVLDFDVTHMVTDERHGRLYFSDQYAKRVYQVDAASGRTTRYFQFDRTPERMFVAPDGKRLYVALLDHPHNYYLGWNETQSGAVGIIDLDSGAKLGQFAVDVDPYDIVVNSAGKVVVTSGSGQWTTIAAYDAKTGLKSGSANIRHLSRLSLHPNQQWVFAANTDVSPSDIEKYDISGDGIRSISDSPYHGEYEMGGNVWAAPNGRHVYTRAGNVFLASSMLHVTTLPQIERIADVAFDVADNSAVVLTDSNKLLRYSLGDFRLLMNFGSGLVDPQFVEIVGRDVIVVDFVSGLYVLKRF